MAVWKTVHTDTRVLVYNEGTITNVQVIQGSVQNITQYDEDGNVVIDVDGPGTVLPVVTWTTDGIDEPFDSTIAINVAPRLEYAVLYGAFGKKYWQLVYRYLQPHFTAWASVVAAVTATFQHCEVLRGAYTHVFPNATLDSFQDTGSVVSWLLHHVHGTINVGTTNGLFDPQNVECIQGVIALLNQCAQHAFADAANLASRGRT